jgi:hypothetical protein
MKFYKDTPSVRASATRDKGYRLLLEDEVKKGIPEKTEYSCDNGISWSVWPDVLSAPGQPIAAQYLVFHFRTSSPLPADGGDIFAGLESLLR